ncbi:MAG: hypothetical protein O8C64_07880 [Candidatus Methanoperedens sp.]|nr:hypothetical protein [Candidatus Methanoperedens sp.]MCZ7406035.1 hypothetical protein [Candidatus Methanoperedens sp.]
MSHEENKTCFVIAPIGDDGTPKRRRSDKVLNHIIAPAAKECGYEAIRADKISKPGIITSHVIQHLIDDPLVIADLSEANPNVFYELAIRHFIGKPIVQIIQTRESIPFNVFPISTIKFDLRDLDSVEKCKNDIISYIHSIEDNPSIGDNPITNVLKEMNIDINMLINKSKEDILEQFKELSNQIIKGIDLIRSEREQLFETIMRSDQNIDSNIKINLSGEWDSDNGLVRIIQDDINVFGEYQWGSDEWVGFINGKIINSKIIFHWIRKNTPSEGCGYWQINDNRLKGGWASATSYAELLKNPGLISEKRFSDWNLWKKT